MKIVCKTESLVIDFKNLEELKAYYEKQRDKESKKPFFRHVQPIYWGDSYHDIATHKKKQGGEAYYSYAYPTPSEAKGYTLELNIYYER